MSTKLSKSFGTMHPLKPHLLQQTGGVAAEVKDIRDDVETAFKNSEGRVGFPELDALDPGTLLAAGQASFSMVGRNLLQGQTFESMLVFGATTKQLDLTVLKPGDTGLSVKIVQGTVLAADYKDLLPGTSVTMTNGSKDVTGVGTTFTALKSGDKIKLDADALWATVASITDDTHLTLVANYADVGGTGAASKQTLDMLVITLAVGSTSNQVATLLNTAGSVAYGKILAAGHGAGVMDPAAAKPFTGGIGLYTGNNVYINGQNCNPVHAASQWTDTSVTVLVPALTGRVATDIVAVVIESDGVRTGQLSAVLT